MQTSKINSSNIVAIGHRDDTLFCLFHHGGAYTYKGVPASKYAEFKAAESAGSFFHSVIKPNYTCTKMDPTSDDAATLVAARESVSEEEVAA